MSLAPDVRALPRLHAEVRGRVITAADADYDAARTVFYGGFDRRPAAIVRPVDADDVACIVDLARDDGLELSVRGGGHSIAGHSTNDDGVVLDLSSLRSLYVDPAARTASVGAGMTTGEYTRRVSEHGLATGFGDAGSVGVGGITLGGGMGFLVREHGLTIDNLLAAEIVTADGKVRHADAEFHPELFWAIRGGGGNFGVVTRLRFRLHPVDQVVAGAMVFPATSEAIAGFVAAAEAASPALSTVANVMTPAPPMPSIPQPLHGRAILFALVAHTGTPDAAGPDLAPFRSLEPLVDEVRPTRYTDLFPADDEHPPFAEVLIRPGYLDAVRPADADAIVGHLATATAAMAAVQLRVLGGAVAAVPNDATAYAHRDRAIMSNIAVAFDSPEERETHRAWMRELATDLFGDDRTGYVNFLGTATADEVRAAYPGTTWDRLREVKRTYDPANLFRSNHTIPPAEATDPRG